MGLKISTATIVETDSGDPLIPALLVDEEELKEFEEYMEKHPFPPSTNDCYSKEDFLADMEKDGIYKIPICAEKTTIDYIEAMLLHVLRDQL